MVATKLKVLQSIVNVTKAGTFSLLYLGRVLTCVVNIVGPRIARNFVLKIFELLLKNN